MSKKKDKYEIVSEVTASMLAEKVHDAIKDRIERLFQKNEELKKEVKEYKEKYLYALADYDNLRKKTKKEKEEIIQITKEYIFLQILPLMDNFERALKAIKDFSFENNEIVKGIDMIFKQFQLFLYNENVEGFESKGKEFDPSLHEAIEVKEDNSLPNNIIVDEFVKGYKYKDKILRPAKVSVNIIKKEVEYERTDNRN